MCHNAGSDIQFPESFIVIIFRKKNFHNFDVGSERPENPVEYKCWSDYDPYGFIQVTLIKIENKENTGSHIKKYHENTENSSDLLHYPVTVHAIKYYSDEKLNK